MKSQCNGTAPSRLAGFTLVELLVVIGIIALLISILLPALNKARKASLDLKCLSNLRQLSLGVNMYVNANRGVFPMHAMSLHSNWDRAIAPYIGFKSSDVDGSVSIPTIRSRLLECPRDDRPDTPVGRFPRSYTANMIRDKGTSRPLDGVVLGSNNWDATTNTPKVPLVKITNVKRSAECCLLFERQDVFTQNWQWTLNGGANVGFLGYADIPKFSNGDIAYHGKKMSILWVDGHATQEDPTEAYRGNTVVTWWARILPG